MSPSPPTPSSLTFPLLQKLLSCYPHVLSRFYESKVKDSRKRTEAIENDAWRYEILTGVIKDRNDDGDEGLTQEEVERLVLWKITHQTNRPFLLPQIRKNPPSVIQTSSAEAQRMLQSSSSAAASRPSIQNLTSTLTAASVPKGIGPATASLLLSVFSPRHVPFFEDELYNWIFPGGDKLKYNVKEYMALVQGVWEAMDRLNNNRNKDEEGVEVEAWMLEKVGFVIGHWDLIEDEGKREVFETTNKHVEEGGLKQKKRRREADVDDASDIKKAKIDESKESPPESHSRNKKVKKESQQRGKKEKTTQEVQAAPRRSERNR